MNNLLTGFLTYELQIYVQSDRDIISAQNWSLTATYLAACMHTHTHMHLCKSTHLHNASLIHTCT